ncbi:MAG: hypothetical protein LAT68_10910 [Cyclobacteriaceae bacterium]|nr:hypothetical protein [Cyclobacteriaceae bacterium]MCH8516825.1 hypothetical protein [Cyclobacteriaceae bacterium]
MAASNNTSVKNKTHSLFIDDHQFDIFHVDRRLYHFLGDWRKNKEIITKILLEKIEKELEPDSAYVQLDMVNPMRKSRLGNFYLDIKGIVEMNNNAAVSIESLGYHQLYVNYYETHDPSEHEIRQRIEHKHGVQQFQMEKSIRMKSLKYFYPDQTLEQLEIMVDKMMTLEGWQENKDNRQHARLRRLELKE